MQTKRPTKFHLPFLRQTKPILAGAVILATLAVIAAAALLFLTLGAEALTWRERAERALKGLLMNLADQELIVTAADTRLPADGKSTASLSVSIKSKERSLQEIAVSAEVLSGDLQVVLVKEDLASKEFLVKAGSQPGEAKILIKGGILSRELTFTLFDPTPPPPPTVASPTDNTTLNDAKPKISGQASDGIKITLFIDAFEMGEAVANQDGQFVVEPKEPLKNGPHLIRLLGTNSLGIKSLPSPAIKITINTKAAEIDLTNLRLKPNPVARRGLFTIFVPASLNSQKLFIVLKNTQYELHDLYGSSIFSGRFAAPDAAGRYPLAIIAQDAAGNTTYLSNAATLIVEGSLT